MFIFALVKFCKESVQTYEMTRQWLPNRYINLLVRESFLYFLAYVSLCPLFTSPNNFLTSFPPADRYLLYNIDFDVITLGSNNLQLLGLTMDMLSYVSLFTLCPRFILSVRELYILDSRRYWSGESGIDTGFGFEGQSPSSVMFEDAEADALSERALEMQAVVNDDGSSK